MYDTFIFFRGGLLKTIQCDVLIIGSGGAGLRAAIEADKSGCNVSIVGKCKKRDAHTILATGGINAALGNMDPEDCWQLHAADTIRDGGMINDPVAVSILCRNAPYAVKELVSWGAKFARDKKSKKIMQRFFGAATYRRACFAGDHTGLVILNTLVGQVLKRKIPFYSEIYITKLLNKDGIVNGAFGIDIQKGEFVVFHAKKVILATGGHSRMFSRSSSRFWENNGDGIKLAYDVGASFMDMEMFQFHPTGMLWPAAAEGILVTEAVRGEGGILTNAKGERFMSKYDKERMELSARDVVARAIYHEIEGGRGTKHGGVWLDISQKPKKYILERLPKVYEQFKKFCKVDISRQKMEVAPTAHYSMGGIYVDHTSGATTVPGLYAIGEVTSGVHGANRLGGNSLAEIMVFGRLTGGNVAESAKKMKKWLKIESEQVDVECEMIGKTLANKKGKDPVVVKKEIQQMMWKHVGVIRNKKFMEQGIRLLKSISSVSMKVTGGLTRNGKLYAYLDVQNMIPCCEMIIRSGLTRKESRGAHFRTDYPRTLKGWHKSIICSPTNRGIVVKTKKIAPIPKEIAKFLKYKKAKAHLLE